MRSKLFVPGVRADLFAKAAGGDADALSFDLEDSVPADAKDAARAAVRAFLTSDDATASRKTMIVRVNALDSADFAADVAALAGTRLDLINLPKAETADSLCEAVAALDRHGIAARLLVNVETPRGLANAAAIAAAHPRVAGLQVGLNDLFEPLGIDRKGPRNVHAALWAVRLAASAGADAFAYDGAWPDIADAQGFRAEAEMARSLGYAGKSCIHPSQVPIANAVFDRVGDVAEARRVVAAARDAAATGRGAFTLDGRMIDRPAIARAEALLAAAGEAA